MQFWDSVTQPWLKSEQHNRRGLEILPLARNLLKCGIRYFGKRWFRKGCVGCGFNVYTCSVSHMHALAASSSGRSAVQGD